MSKDTIEVVLRFRPEEPEGGGGHTWLVARIYSDGKQMGEVSRIRADLFNDPGDKLYHDWAHAVSLAFNSGLARMVGVPEIKSRRVKSGSRRLGD